MQKLLSSFLIFIITPLGLLAQNETDVLHYKFYIEVNDQNDTIYGKAEIKMIFNQPTDSISLDLYNVDESGKGMKVTGVTGPVIRNFRQEREKLIVKFSDASKRSDTGSFVVIYKGIPDDGLIISRNKFGHRTFFSDNWPNRAHHWLPCKDEPGDKASVEFMVTAPDHYQVVSNGLQIEETNLPENKRFTYWKEDMPLPTKIMVVGIAAFAVQYVGNAEDIPVYSWVYPENKAEGFYDYEQAMEILPFFIDYVGPYPYKKLANVQSKTIFGGMENAGAIFYSENSISGKREKETLLAHEIAHQWFGDMVSEKDFSHVWLSEGFATYFTNLYMENKYGREKMIEMLEKQRNEVVRFSKDNERAVIDNSKDLMSLLNANSYQKGGWVLHMLRLKLGDEIFHKVIQTYYRRFAGKNADTDDFRKVAEEISGKELGQFFKQWLYTPGLPKLEITWKKNVKDKEVVITVEQMQKEKFEFPLQIGLMTEKTSMDIKAIHITNKKETFKIAYSTDFDSLVPDPEVALLCETYVKKTK